MAEPATLRFDWPTRWTSLAAVVAIEVDGRRVGRLRNGQTLVTRAESGRHNLLARTTSQIIFVWHSVPLELTLAPGEEARLELRFSKPARSSRSNVRA